MRCDDHLRGRFARRQVLQTGGFLIAGMTLGCTLPGQGAPPQIIRLSAAEDFPPNIPSVAWTLRVAEPNATSRLNSAKIAYVPQGEEMQYLSTGEWASRAPEMVMELLVESFKNTGKVLSVGDRRARIRPDFELFLQLFDFQMTETGSDSGEVTVTLEARLIKRPRRNEVASFSWESKTQVQGITLGNIVAAFQESLSEVMAQTVEWTLQTGAGAGL